MGRKHLVLSQCGLFLLAFAFFTIFGILENWHLSRDTIGYLRDAGNAAEGYYYSVPYGQKTPPLLVMIMVHMNHWFGIPCQMTGFFFCIFCGAMCPVMIFSGIYKLFHDYWLAVLSAVLYFLIPGIRNVAVNILRDSPSLCLNLAGMCSFILYRQTPDCRSAFMASVFFTLAFAFRFENVEFLLLSPLANIFLDFCEDSSFIKIVKKNFIFVLCETAGFLSGFLLVKGICLNCNYYSTDNFFEIIRGYIRVW